jgi:hypothetical protein
VMKAVEVQVVPSFPYNLVSLTKALPSVVFFGKQTLIIGEKYAIESRRVMTLHIVRHYPSFILLLNMPEINRRTI